MKQQSVVLSVAYLPATTVLAELRRMVDEVSSVGVRSEDTTVGGSFEEWSDRLGSGQTAWIYSLDRFHSITELMSYHELMSARGITVRSVRERWFNDPTVSGTEVLGHLFRLGEEIHQQTQVAMRAGFACRSSAEGQTVSSTMAMKVVRAIELRMSRRLSVVSACRMAGCGVNAYYRYLKEQGK